ncbi:Hpt domain-containing protein [Undibacterium sp.]|uniref:Hpt domain-containing protein n=1 Tax=Undibacterium sp. TaxID=1914977 RepID=UPI00374CDEE4
MTSDFSVSSEEQFDIGPLSWVMGEVREAITSAGKQLSDAIGQDSETQATMLRHAKSYLHQAHGALQIVDIDGVSIVTETIEDLIDRLHAGQLELNGAHVEVISDAFHAVLSYLEDLLSGSPHQPVRLFPYYRSLLELRGADRIHPADLFFPALSVQEQIPELTVSQNILPVNYAGLRQRFEKLLLPVLTSKDAAQQKAGALAMHDLIKEVEQGQTSPQAKAFWVVMRGFVEAVAQGSIDNTQYVKQIFGRINLQIRRLVDGVTNIPERLLRDALFFIAQVKQPSPFVAQIRKAYQLENQVPLDYEQKNYGQVAANVLASAKEHLSHVKNLWGRIANGEAGLADKFAGKMKELADAGTGLGSAPLTKLLRELNGLARHAAHAPESNNIGLELATSLLFVENALDHIMRLPANFSERADEITARLLSIVSGDVPETQAAWISEISKEAQQRQTMAVLVGEMQNSLRQAEKTLDEYFRDPVSKDSLKPIDGVLHQVGGALAILDQDDAMLAVEHTRNMIAQFPDVSGPEHIDANAAVYQNVAQNIGALSFFIETLQNQPEAAKKKFSFDAEHGLFRSNMLEKPAEKELLPASYANTTQQQNKQHEAPAVVTAEQELVLQQQQSAKLAASLADHPDSSELQAQLKDSLEQERSVAHLLDDPAASDRARAAISLLDNTDFSAAPDAGSLNDIVAATNTEHHSAPAADLVIPGSDEAIDAELLEIFLMEADEVLEFVQKTIPLSRHDTGNQEYLTSLRRSFHTLKGSGRMVGLNAFGEAAWSIEQVMNLWLSDSRNGNETLYSLLDKAAQELFVWVEDLKQKGQSSRTGASIIAAAERVKAGQSFTYEEPAAVVTPAAAVAAASVDSPAAAASELSSHELTSIDSLPHAEQAASLDAGSVDIESLEFAPLDFDTPALPESAQVADIPADLPVLDIPSLSPAPTVEAVPDWATAAASEPEILLEALHIQDLPAEGDVATHHAEEAAAVPEIPELDLLPEAAIATEFAMPGEHGHVLEEFAEPAAGHSAPDAFPEVSSEAQAETLIAASADTLADTLAEASHEIVREAEPVAPVEPLHLITDAPAEPVDVPEALLLEDHGDHAGHGHEHQVVHHDNVFQLEAAQPPENLHLVSAADTHDGELAQVLDFPDMSQAAPMQDDNIKRIGDIEISLPLHTIYMAETDEIVRYLAQDFAEWRHESHRPVSLHAVHAAHSLAGSSATVGLKAAQELAHALELVLQRIEKHPVVLDSAEFDVLDNCVECVKRMLQKFALSEMAERAPDEVHNLEILLQALSARADSDADPAQFTAAAEIIDITDVPVELVEPLVEIPASIAVVPAFEPATAALDPELRIKDDLDADLLPVFIEEGNDLLPMVGQLLRSWQQHPDDGAIPQSILRLMHTIKGSARMAGAMQLGQHTHDMEARIENLMHAGGAVRQPLLDDLLMRHDHSMHLFERLQNPAVAEVPAPSASAALVAAVAEDEPMQGSEFDGSLLQEPALTGDQQTAAKLPAVQDSAPARVQSTLTTAPPRAVVTASPLVRVRADILDRLVNQAGEVSISRSKLENEVGTLRSSLVELTENVNRLRDQLREVEIQAETQISSRMSLSGDREFDPLEFDRFTRLQELTRMMAESVSDVATVQTNLTRTIDGASDGLHTQARLTRELQQDLMRVRMVPFASISERLYRVTRQASKELDKRVNLDIRGASVEMDRSVLEKMAGPFEHLLRNAIVHGIESRDRRSAAGKNEIGELLVEVRQEGNEVVIHFTDDGQGLNLGRIREKAKAVGLLGYDDEATDAEAVNMIFEPGFSTASEVTELAGRGVGMDVVRSEAASLGGRVAVTSVDGKGAHFTIHLPLTLAVTQVVILTSGGRTYALPSVLVEQVQQLKAPILAAAYNDGAIMWQGNRVVLHYLSTMLGEHDTAPVSQQYSPVLIMKSGSERVAIHVDDVVGNREVVVKNIGPQLSRMVGIAGATVLGSGEIVLILNPVPLAAKMEHEQVRHPLAQSESGLPEMGAVADMAHNPELNRTQVQPVQGLRTQHIVMVVDDSLTVRRVTQRLLSREGYQVVLAKDGIDALEQLQSVTPDVMLVDIEMPRMDGFDLTRNVRSDARTAAIPIIMITSRTADKHKNYAYELGVNEYFGKPYREDDLLEAITRFVGEKAAN